MCPTHDLNAKSQDRMEIAVFRKCLAGKAFLRDTRETFCFAELSILIHSILTHTIYTPLPTYVEMCFWEKTLATNLESLRLLYPQFSTQLLMDFPQLLPLHFHTIEKLIAQTLTTPFQSFKWGFGAAGKYWKKLGFGRCNRAYYRIQRASQDTVLRSLVGVRTWRT